MQKTYLERDEEKPVKREENKGVKTHMRGKEGKIRKKRPQSGGLDRDERVRKRTRVV